MNILIDHADIHTIKEMYAVYPIDGVTCNPTILSRTKREPYEVLKGIRELIGFDADLHVQVLTKDANSMVKEGHTIQKVLGDHTYIKIPVTVEGLKAIRILSLEGANVTGTVVYNQMQGYLAAKAGAKFVAPYVNRLDSMGFNGVQIAKDIHDMLKKAGMKTEVLAASFKNTQQVLELCKHGLGAVTLAPDVMNMLIKNDLIEIQVDQFTCDFEQSYGKDKSMLL